jgi:alpha-beta hydrolase superfamily lysophospholipase
MSYRIRLVIGAAAGALVAGALYLARLRPLAVQPCARPAAGYEEARRRFDALQRAGTEAINPLCRHRLLDHGRKMARAIVFLHGFTNCPHQFDQLARQFFARGYNVLVMRLPRHGLADRLTTALSSLTSEEMVALTAEALDIAHGLGEHVTLFGFSLGGSLAAWAAQQRADLDLAVLAAPALGLCAVPPWRSRATSNLLALAPERYRWWDPVRKDERVGPAHAYPRYSLRALGELLRTGCLVQEMARRDKPAAGAVLVITNPCDAVVDNHATAQVVAHWRRNGANIRTQEFPAAWQLIHDWMDPAQTGQQVARVYPLLLAWVAEEGVSEAVAG